MRLNVLHNSSNLSHPEQISFVILILKSPIMLRLSNLFTALLKEIVNSSKVSMFEEDGGLYRQSQMKKKEKIHTYHLFLDRLFQYRLSS